MNNINLVGNITKDAELSFLPGKGTATLKYTLAVPKNMNRNESQYIPIVTFGKLAESLVAYMSKGTKVAVTGELQVNNKKGDDGKYTAYVSVVTTNVEMLGGKKKEQDTFGTSSKEHDPFADNSNNDFEGEPVDDGDMPF